jgi:hypothetical protein
VHARQLNFDQVKKLYDYVVATKIAFEEQQRNANFVLFDGCSA